VELKSGYLQLNERHGSFGMLLPLALAFVLVGVSVVIHALGTLAVIDWLANLLQKRQDGHGRLAAGILTIRVVCVLMVLHLLEALAWAALYWLARVIPDGESAFYYSLTSYTTVGYGDVVLPPHWRLLGPIEAGTGILMFGWSTGVMVAAINRIHGDRFQRLAEPSVPRDGANAADDLP
jgi:hypothetical protein